MKRKLKLKPWVTDLLSYLGIGLGPVWFFLYILGLEHISICVATFELLCLILLYNF